MFDFDVVIDLLRSDGSVVVNKNLARNIGLDCAVLYSELASKYKYFKAKGQLTEDGFFFNTVDNLKDDTCLSDYQQRECIKKLKKLGLVDNRVQGLPAKRYFKIIPDMEILHKYLQHQERQQKSNNLIPSNEVNKELHTQKLQGNNTNLNNTKKIINNNDNASALPTDGVVSVDNLTNDSKEVYVYFTRSYFSNTGKAHPTLTKKVVDRLNKIMEDAEIYDSERDTELYVDVEAMQAMIDKYFITSYALPDGSNIDYRIYHFLSDGIMKNLYYKSGCY